MVNFNARQTRQSCSEVKVKLGVVVDFSMFADRSSFGFGGVLWMRTEAT